MLGVAMVLMTIAANPETDASERVIDPRCGSNCLYLALQLLDCKLESLKQLEDVLGAPSPKGFTLAQLADAARRFNVETLGVETSFQNLTRRTERFACIAHVDGGHFVLFHDVSAGKVTVVDPPRIYEMPSDTMRTRWKGTALLLANRPLTREEKLNPNRRWIAIAACAGLAVGVLWFMRRRTLTPR